MTIPAHPLSWPTGWRRTSAERRTHGKFGKRERDHSSGYTYARFKDLTIAESVRRVRDELERMGISDEALVISSNLQLRLDGMPRSDQRQPADPGVAVYWRDRGDVRCMAIDRYVKVEHNLAAIAATIEAMRAIERHGGAEILDRAFTGFVALEGPAKWWDVLQVDQRAPYADVRAAYQRRRAETHPDRGGTSDDFDRVQKAYEEFCRVVGVAP